MKVQSIAWTAMLAALLAACQPSPAPTTAAPSTREPTATQKPTATARPTEIPATETPTPTATATPVPVFGPDEYPEAVNPLTGLPVEDPAVLERAPLLIMVSNESPEVRPQSGVSYADHVWEYQMEGFRQTRWTAVIYSQTPERVGSVRSIRLINIDHLRLAYDGLLVISGASTGVYQVLQFEGFWDHVFREEQDRPHLVRIRDVPRPNTDFYHALFAVPEEVWRYAEERGVNQAPDLHGLAFSEALPDSGEPTTNAQVDFLEDGPIHRWAYDETTGRWLSFTTDQKAMTEEAPDMDALTGEQLAFENVVILYAEHYLSDIIEAEPNLASPGVTLTGEGDAVLLRDGVRYEVTWQRDADDMLRLVDGSGEPVPLKPGRTWFMVVSSNMYQPSVSFEP